MSIRRWGAGMTLLVLAACGQPVTAASDDPGLVPTTTTTTTPSTSTTPPTTSAPAPPQTKPTDISDADWQAGQAAADRIRPPLENLKAAGDFSLESTRQVLTKLGYQEVGTTTMNQPDNPGAVFGFRVAGACVQGAVRPDRVQIEVAKRDAEWACMPPGVTH
jgi:hypothetical protein